MSLEDLNKELDKLDLLSTGCSVITFFIKDVKKYNLIKQALKDVDTELKLKEHNFQAVEYFYKNVFYGFQLLKPKV